MVRMGQYCKAYSVKKLREFAGWVENKENTRKEKRDAGGKEIDAPGELTDADYLYLQEDFTVTDSIFIDENVIFDQVTPEWIEFCKDRLNFQPPDYQAADAAPSQ